MFLSTTPPDPSRLISAAESPGYGAVAAFVGLVRDHHGGRQVLRLEYSAYAPMAESECARIVAEAEARWPVRALLQHAIGPLGIGDVAVAVAVGGAHREEAFAACRYVIEEVKRRVPIWKKEFYADGTVEWVGAGRAMVGDSSGGSAAP